MLINVTLRYPHRTRVNIKTTEDVPEGCTVGELCSSVVNTFEKQNDIRFTGSTMATLLNGKLVTGETPLNDGDEVMIIPVASGG